MPNPRGFTTFLSGVLLILFTLSLMYAQWWVTVLAGIAALLYMIGHCQDD